MKVVAAALYDEGAVTVINAVLVNCRLMFERSSNNYGKLLSTFIWSCLLLFAVSQCETNDCRCRLASQMTTYFCWLTLVANVFEL